MTRRTRLFALTGALLAFVAGALYALRSQPEAAAIGRLVARSGDSIERDFAGSEEQWQLAQVGESFFLGDGIRTGAQSSAVLALADASELSLDQHALIRFLADVDDQAGLGIDVKAGTARLHTGKAPLALRTQVGLATITAESEVLLNPGDGSVSFDVRMGSVQFKDPSGESHNLQRGQAVTVGIGMALLDSAPEPARAEPDAGALVVRTARGTLQTRGPKASRFSRLEAGPREIPAGTALKLGRGSEGVLSQGPRRATLSGAGDFVAQASDEAWLVASAGSFSAEVSGEAMTLAVPGGTLLLRESAKGTSVRATVTSAGGKLRVERGRVGARLLDESLELSTGQEHTWSLEAAPDDAGDGVLSSLDHHSLKVTDLRSFVVHAPEVPVAVGFDVADKCQGEALLQLRRMRQRVRGTGVINANLAAGSQPYLVRCVETRGPGRPVLRGTITVLRDAGTRKLPPKPPMSSVEADGRKYTIYYPNQLPSIEVRWPNPPEAKEITLDVDGKRMTLSQPVHVFKSGKLRDGSHRLTFYAGKRRSRTTTVVVRFDNTAATASILKPADRGFSAGESVPIEGVALKTWNVSIEGGEVTQYANDKFSGEVATSTEHPDIVVRLTNRRKGTHFYLRRASESP